jgi:hypothetical protein
MPLSQVSVSAKSRNDKSAHRFQATPPPHNFSLLAPALQRSKSPLITLKSALVRSFSLVKCLKWSRFAPPPTSFRSLFTPPPMLTRLQQSPFLAINFRTAFNFSFIAPNPRAITPITSTLNLVSILRLLAGHSEAQRRHFSFV